MSIIDRIRSVAAGRLEPTISSTVGSALPGMMGVTAAGALGALIRQGPAAAKGLLPSLNSLPDLILGEVARASETSLQWTAAPLYGGLTLDRYRELFVEAGMTQRAWKNLWFISIDEFKASKESPAGAGPINLMALDVSFTPCTMPGEAVPIGGANVDKLESTERVEIRLTTMDDARGSLKRWFIAKCDQVAHTDGTMGLPADYLVVLNIVQMDPSGEAGPEVRMRHKFLARPTNIDIELSRRSKELEELAMGFVQADTFLVPA